MKHVFATLLVILLTAIPAIFQGRFANRWGQPPSLSLAGQQLHEFPREIGLWRCAVDEHPLSQAVCHELGLEEHFHRRYIHAESGKRLDILLMVGPPGRLVRHPPEVCYTNRAHQKVGETSPLEVTSQSKQHQFKLLRFQRLALPWQEDFSVAYAYATKNGDWTTPHSPRLTFGAAPVLYKLQVLTETTDQDAMEDVHDFLKQFTELFPAIAIDNRTSEPAA